MSGAIGVHMSVDGTTVALLQVSVNETLPSIVASRSATADPHAITFEVNGSSTGTDNYDVFNLTVLELPIP